jgi:DNA repair exonuclease SbcCD ATPase subunit
MILFKAIRWQNMLSTGNQFTEVKLDRSKSTLIVGENGAGKSTILDALSFALYGKPFRNINKPQLLNSMTQKNLVVECEFMVGSKHFRVKRGIKPQIFEIYQNGEMMNQNSSARDYQEYLEKSILKLSFKSFGQIVILGSANYLPFMQLPAHSRREVIEDLLDIQIFTTMNNLLKEKITTNRSAITDTDYQINLIENKIELTLKHINSLKINNDHLIRQKEEMIEEVNGLVCQAERDIAVQAGHLTVLTAKVSDSDKVTSKKSKLLELESQLESKVRTLKKEIRFYHDNDSCPTCRQGIDHDFKNETIEDRKNKEQEVSDALVKIENEITTINDRIVEITEINAKITVHNTKITELNSDIRSWNNSIRTLEAEIDNLEKNTTIIDASNEDLSVLNKQLSVQQKYKEELANERQVIEVAGVLLKDSGIKTKIIKQYVPIMNKLINKYLAAMDFFVQFELDENFNEKIKSRFRDEFSYASFSEGEKMRIDLALMFTWRAIAKLRNSASTNLLIMDEVFDSSLDVGGTEEFLKILEGLTAETNTFIISHKGDQLFDKFHSVIKFEKHKNFSRIAA